MPHRLRVQYPGAVYHVMNRGDRREPIFLDDHDRQRFLEALGNNHDLGLDCLAYGDGPLANRRQCVPSGDPEKALNTPIVVSGPFMLCPQNEYDLF